MISDFDVVVIGGGPAGATAASYLAGAGLSVAVFESEMFPREHVGESPVPAVTPVLQETGALGPVDAAGFVRKYGAAWTSAESRNIPHNGFTGLDHAMQQICWDRFVFIGDAGRFVDPIFSGGVGVALNSARLAAKDIIEAHKAGDFSKARFSVFESKLRKAVKNWYEFISIYYRLNILFTAFVQDPRYRIDVLKMLQGDFYDGEEPAALIAMRGVLDLVENDPTHLWHPYLGTLRAPSAAPAF
jgi:flavin-dependent dehydrogenase